MVVSDLALQTAAIAHADLDLEPLCLAFDEVVRRAVPYTVAAWSTHDPATGLFTSCTMAGLPKDLEREAQLFRDEFRDDEPATFRCMIARRQTTAILSAVTGGDLERASRYRSVLAPFGVSDELRAVLWSADTPWGSVTMYRNDGARFTTAHARQMEQIATHLGEGLRLSMLRLAAARPEAVKEPPGILAVAPDGTVTPLTGPARRWLQLGGTQLRTTANATAAAVRARTDWEGATARLALPDGLVLTLHGAATTVDDGSVAVIVDRTRRAEVGAMLVEAYGLTPRQRDVLGLLLLGASLTQIGHRLGISEHTANDHRKAIYRRVGVSSRSELAALLQSEQYEPRTHRGVPPSPYGGFLE